MATDSNIDPASQTANMAPPDTSDNQTPPNGDPPETPESLKAKLDAALSDVERWKGRVDKANKEKKAESKTETAKATLDEEEVDFRIQHIDELKVYGSTYKELRSKGYDRSDALELAKLKHQKSTTQSAEAQAANSSPSPVANRSISSDVITDQDQQDMQTWGFSKETLIAHKKLKQQRSGK